MLFISFQCLEFVVLSFSLLGLLKRAKKTVKLLWRVWVCMFLRERELSIGTELYERMFCILSFSEWVIYSFTGWSTLLPFVPFFITNLLLSFHLITIFFSFFHFLVAILGSMIISTFFWVIDRVFIKMRWKWDFEDHWEEERE